MKAEFAATQDLVDAALAAKELAQQIKNKMEFEKNSCGIVFYDYDIDADNFVASLYDELGFDIYGCSTFATLGTYGYSEMSALLVVLTSDDCTFSGAVVPELKNDGFESEIKKMYFEASDRISSKPKLIITFGNIVNDISIEAFVSVLSVLSDNCPIFGCIAADDSTFTMQSIVYGRHSFGNKAFSVLMIEGDINPEFVLKSVPVKSLINTATVTKSSINTVYEIGGHYPIDFLNKTGLLRFGDSVTPEELIQLLFAYPLLVKPEKSNTNNNAPFVRVISKVDTDNNSLSFCGTVPEGSEVSVCYITEDDIINTFQAAIMEANQLAKEKNASCILAVSCTARSYMFIGNADAEGRAVTKLLQCNIPFAGCYGFGEMIPTLTGKSGEASNAFHNWAVGLCIL